MEQTTPTRITLPLPALDAVVEAALEVSAVLAVPPCALEEQPPKTPAAIAAAMVRERTRVAFFIVSPSFMFVLLSSLGYRLTKQKARSPAVKRVPHAFVQKQNLFCSFYAFVSGIRTGSAAFALRTPLSLLRVWMVLIIAYCQNFASTFCRHQGDFCRRSPYSIKLFLRFSSRIPVFAFFFSVKLSFGLNNFKITAFPPHHWVMPGSGRPSPAILFRCFSPPYVVTALFIKEFLCQFLMSSKISHCFSLYRFTVLYRMFVLFCGGFFRHFPILYIL